MQKRNMYAFGKGVLNLVRILYSLSMTSPFSLSLITDIKV